MKMTTETLEQQLTKEQEADNIELEFKCESLENRRCTHKWKIEEIKKRCAYFAEYLSPLGEAGYHIAGAIFKTLAMAAIPLAYLAFGASNDAQEVLTDV